MSPVALLVAVAVTYPLVLGTRMLKEALPWASVVTLCSPVS